MGFAGEVQTGFHVAMGRRDTRGVSAKVTRIAGYAEVAPGSRKGRAGETYAVVSRGGWGEAVGGAESWVHGVSETA